MYELMCKVEYNPNNHKLKFESATNKGLTITQIIDDDQRYGKMKPANGKYFTFTVLDEDQEFTKKQAKRAWYHAYRRWRIYGNLPKAKYVTPDYDGVIDFRLDFRTVEGDEDGQLQENTVMYHYYPINDVTNRFRGLCVVNKKFFYTSHGNSVSGHFLKSRGFEVQYLDGSYESLDFDATLGHELGHGLGLPHDPEPENMMSFRVDLMVEFPSERDQARISAESKYGPTTWSARTQERWLDWLKLASDR